ncbi:hypothetical protein BLNAU_24499 [Blattamonas nauphoetae]|nr:hypothetical protein BLNAU_24499 [Blattamonas nauphoetae]
MILPGEERRDINFVHLFPFLGAESQARFLSSFIAFHTSTVPFIHSSLERMVECLLEVTTVTSNNTPIALLTKLKKVTEFLSGINPETRSFENSPRYVSPFEKLIVKKLQTAEGEERWRLLTQLVVVSRETPDIANELMKVENETQALFFFSLHIIRSTPRVALHLETNPDAFRRVVELVGHTDSLPLIAVTLPHIADAARQFVIPPDDEAPFQIELKPEMSEIVIRSLRMITSHRREGGKEGCVGGKDEMTS